MPAVGMRVGASRLDSITSLRFFAALFVVLHHAFGPDGILVLHTGYLGVTFFFVLSGFVLTWSGSTRHGTAAFYRNRFARIWPLQIVTLVVAAFLPYGSSDNWGTFVQNVTLTQAWTYEGSHSFNWVSWSISDEAFFYLLFPVALLLITRLRRAGLLMAVIGSVGVLGIVPLLLNILDVNGSAFLTYNFPPYRLFEFVIGICLARWMMMPPAPVKPRLVSAFWISAGVFSVIVIIAGSLTQAYRPLVSVLFIPGTIALIHWAVTRELSGGVRWLRVRPLVKLGEWSFALYLVHMLVIRPIAATTGGEYPGYLDLGWGVLAVVLSIVLSAAASEWIEKPVERLLRAKSRRPEPAALAADPM